MNVIKTYVVNMDKDTGKRKQIEAQLVLHPELDYQIWKAVEGRKLTVEQQSELISPKFKERYGKGASLPAAGCSLSHLGIYRDMIEKELSYALILEDDAILSSDLKLESLVKLLDTEKPVAILLTPDFWYKKRGLVVGIDERHNVYELYDGYMTSGYMINLALAKLIAPKLLPIHLVADEWKIFISYGIKLFGIVPHVVSFPDGIGEIGMAGDTPKTFLQKIRSRMISVYISLCFVKKYMGGHRKSRKNWR